MRSRLASLELPCDFDRAFLDVGDRALRPFDPGPQNLVTESLVEFGPELPREFLDQREEVG